MKYLHTSFLSDSNFNLFRLQKFNGYDSISGFDRPVLNHAHTCPKNRKCRVLNKMLVNSYRMIRVFSIKMKGQGN